jgi:chromosome segregation and condensation protein ScpB
MSSAKDLIEAILLAKNAGLTPRDLRQWVEAMHISDPDDVGGTLVEVEGDDDDDDDDTELKLGFR